MAPIISYYNPGFRNPEPATWGQRPHAGIVLARAYRPKGKEGSRQANNSRNSQYAHSEVQTVAVTLISYKILLNRQLRSDSREEKKSQAKPSMAVTCPPPPCGTLRA